MRLRSALAFAAVLFTGASGQRNLRGTSCHEAVKASLGQSHQNYVKTYANPPFSVLAGYSERNGTQIIEGNFQYKEDDALIKDSHVKYTNELESTVVEDVCRRLDDYVEAANKKAINDQLHQQQDDIKVVDTKVSRVKETAQTGVGLAAAQWFSVGLLVLDGSCNEGKIIKKIVSLIKSAIKSKSEDQIQKLENEIIKKEITADYLRDLREIFEILEGVQETSELTKAGDVELDCGESNQKILRIKNLINRKLKEIQKHYNIDNKKLSKLKALETSIGFCGVKSD
ncbi:MAG: hypothetical protein ACON35_07530 [Candidatus Marinamargulisbacteria bacterium]